MNNRFYRTFVAGLGLAALLNGCTPPAQPASTPAPHATTSAPATPAPTAAASETPAPSATASDTPSAVVTPTTSGTPAVSGATGANVPTVEGVTITVVKPGSGKALVAGEPASFHYTGWLEGFESDKKFDSSRDRNQPLPLTIGTGQVIPGWDQGLVGMQPGEVRRLEISSKMGYGEAGRPPIPPNSTLFFEVEYVPVK